MENKEEKFYTFKSKEQLEEEALTDLGDLRKTIEQFKEISEELCFKLSVMTDGIERFIKFKEKK
jgi:hypothetical protein